MTEKQLKDTPIYYWTGGNLDGECIIFVHAAYADHTSFDKQFKAFSDYKIIALDLIGHGKSLKAKKGDGIDKTAEYISGIMEAENIKQAHFVGVSLGALLIQDFANKHQDRVASLFCVGAYDINNFDEKLNKENSKQQSKMIMKAMISIKWFAKSIMPEMAITPEAQQEFYRMNTSFKKSSFRFLSGLSKLINKHKTSKRSYPLTIAYGDNELPLAIKGAKMWHESEPDSKIIVIDNAGHLANMDNPDEFNRILQASITNEDLKKDRSKK